MGETHINMQINREKRKKEVRELTIALMHQSRSNQPVCETCGNRFKPDEEEITVELPEEDIRAAKTSFTEKPDYCSEKCRTADQL